MKRKHEIITLCGSTKFKDEFRMMRERLTLEGFIVLGPEVYSQADGRNLTEMQKAELSEIHKEKIDMADLVFIVNPQGYIGENTKREIAYAKKKKKNIIYLNSD